MAGNNAHGIPEATRLVPKPADALIEFQQLQGVT
jgi:hypothetical protein